MHYFSGKGCSEFLESMHYCIGILNDHLGYKKSERSDSDDYRNGYKRKRVNSRYGSLEAPNIF